MFWKAGEQAVLRATENISAQVMEEPSIFNSPVFRAVTVLDTEFQVAKSSMLFLSSVSGNQHPWSTYWANETDMLHSSILLWSETKNQELEQFAMQPTSSWPRLNLIACIIDSISLSFHCHISHLISGFFHPITLWKKWTVEWAVQN